MAPRPAPQQRPAPDLLPDSLPGKDQPDVLPDDLRRRDQPDATPDSLPKISETIPLDARKAPDGGLAQHPIHDEDLEDLRPEDYEAQIDVVEEQTLNEHPEGSAPPLDRLTQDREPDKG